MKDQAPSLIEQLQELLHHARQIEFNSEHDFESTKYQNGRQASLMRARLEGLITGLQHREEQP